MVYGQCDTCERDFGLRGSLVAHVGRVHGWAPGEPVACEECARPFRYKKNLAEHWLLKGHGPEPDPRPPAWRCGACGARFPRRALLQRHRASDCQRLGRRLQRCPHCFSLVRSDRRDNLQRHLKRCAATLVRLASRDALLNLQYGTVDLLG